MTKRYPLPGPVARSLETVGDRWTLLVVRELLLGPARYAELERALPGIPSNLLAERLRLLEEEGIPGAASPVPKGWVRTFRVGLGLLLVRGLR